MTQKAQKHSRSDSEDEHAKEPDSKKQKRVLKQNTLEVNKVAKAEEDDAPDADEQSKRIDEPRWQVTWPKDTPEAVKALYTFVLDTRGLPTQTLITRVMATTVQNFLIRGNMKGKKDASWNTAAFSSKQLTEYKKLYHYDGESLLYFPKMKNGLELSKRSDGKPFVVVEEWPTAFLSCHINDKTDEHRSLSKTFKRYSSIYGFGMSEDILDALMSMCDVCHPSKKKKDPCSFIKLSYEAERKIAIKAFEYTPKLDGDEVEIVAAAKKYTHGELALSIRVLFFCLMVKKLFAIDATQTRGVVAGSLNLLYERACQSTGIPDMEIGTILRSACVKHHYKGEVERRKGSNCMTIYWGLKPRDETATKVLKGLSDAYGDARRVLQTRKASEVKSAA